MCNIILRRFMVEQPEETLLDAASVLGVKGDAGLWVYEHMWHACQV